MLSVNHDCLEGREVSKAVFTLRETVTACGIE